jgi:ketosteroid isomerase-like protein
MSQENVDLVRRGLDHFIATGEVPWEMFDDQVEVYDHDTPDQDVYRGHDGYGRWLGDWGAAWAEWSIEPKEFIDAGDRIVILFRMKAKGRESGVEIERQDALVYQLRDGKIVRGDYYNNREQALKAVGLAQ